MGASGSGIGCFPPVGVQGPGSWRACLQDRPVGGRVGRAGGMEWPATPLDFRTGAVSAEFLCGAMRPWSYNTILSNLGYWIYYWANRSLARERVESASVTAMAWVANSPRVGWVSGVPV